MSEPGVVPPVFASQTNFDATSGLPPGASALEGTPTKVAPPSTFWLFGLIPGRSLKSQWVGYFLGLLTDWVRWVSEALATVNRSAHLVKTNSNGKTGVQYLLVGDGTGTGGNEDHGIQVVADNGKYGIHCSGGATSLALIDATSVSTAHSCAYFRTTSTTQRAINAIGVDGLTIDATTEGGTAVNAESTNAGGGLAVRGENANTVDPAILGVGPGIGVQGLANAVAGTGVHGESDAAATSLGEGVRGVGLNLAPGVRAIAAAGNAIEASCTGSNDEIVCLSAGTGAPLRLTPTVAAPATQRTGQIWTEQLTAFVTALRFCADTVSPYHYVMTGKDQQIRSHGFDAGSLVAQATANAVLCTAAVNSPTAVVTVAIHANVRVKPSPIGLIPTLGACVLELWDVANAVSIRTTTVDVPADGVSACCWTLSTDYALPANATNIELRVTVTAGVGGNLAFFRPALQVVTSAATMF